MSNQNEMNYLAYDIKENHYYRIYGCTSEAEASKFVGLGQKLIILSDEELTENNIRVIEN